MLFRSSRLLGEFDVRAGLPPSVSVLDEVASQLAAEQRWRRFVDELYDSVVVEPMIDGSRVFLWRTVDARGIDGIVNGAGKTARGIGGILKRLQSGSIRGYAAWVVAGSLLVIAFIGVRNAGLLEALMGGLR